MLELITSANLHELRARANSHPGTAACLEMKRRGEILDYGGEHIIVQHPTHSDKLIAVKYWGTYSRDKGGDVFDAHKVLSTLFPHNFPRVYAVASVPNLPADQQSIPTYLCGTVREKIALASSQTAQVDYPLTAVTGFFSSMDVPLSPMLEWKTRNMGIGLDGGEYFLDIAEHPRDLGLLRTAAVDQWMRTHTVFDKRTYRERPYKESERIHVIHNIQRIQDRAIRA